MNKKSIILGLMMLGMLFVPIIILQTSVLGWPPRWPEWCIEGEPCPIPDVVVSTPVSIFNIVIALFTDAYCFWSITVGVLGILVALACIELVVTRNKYVMLGTSILYLLMAVAVQVFWAGFNWRFDILVLLYFVPAIIGLAVSLKEILHRGIDKTYN
ncbi:MAG: hypothetical protein FWE31_05020 [Firmicutes bacterium]|nr:hypothetical protein [Bacillota bacterium]